MVVRFFAVVLAMALATLVVPGIHMTSSQTSTDIAALVGVAVVFGFANAGLKPIFARVGRSPIGLIVLALVLLLANAGLLLLISTVCQAVGVPWKVAGPLSALAGAFVISVVSFLVNSLFGTRGEEHR